MTIAYIALGSNLNNPVDQIKTAFTELASLHQSSLLATSSLYKSKPLILPNTKIQEIPDYINAVICLKTSLLPLELLYACHNIENTHARKRQEKWAPRTLDLDILLYDDLTIHSEDITIPHPEMFIRNFVMYPLIEIAPKLVFPNGDTIQSILEALSTEGLIKL